MIVLPRSLRWEGLMTVVLCISVVAGIPAAIGQSVNEAQKTAASDRQKPSAEVQPEIPNTLIVVTATRMDIPLNATPGSTAVVGQEVLSGMPRGIAADEALKLVPGIKVDNQADGERVHISIRGQGLLTERGIRGIKVLLDGLPVNDPTGFAPDLFDVDWSTVQRVEVFRGPASALYGGGAAGGVINITTRDGGAPPYSGDASIDAGSYGFWKALAEVGGTVHDFNYRISASRNQGDGYRDHTAFDATNLYGKFRWTPGKSVRLTAILAGTSFVNENAEGLNLDWLLQDRRMANPDALAFNEYQRTRRVTGGLTGQVAVRENQDLQFSLYYRHTLWRESVPSSVQHRSYDTPGGILQYNIHSGKGWLKNHFSLGGDFDWQSIREYRHPNLRLAQEGPALLSLQDIRQRGAGFYFLDRVELGSQWGLTFDVRSDRIRNELTDRLKAGGTDLSGSADYVKATGRAGLSWNPRQDFGLYTSWGQGFLPPATEELANNPDQLGGFNRNLVPATSRGEEVGARGSLGRRLFYDVALFHLATDNDFGRYRVSSRPLETFYQNAGSSRRYGLEGAGSWYPAATLALRVAYTYSDFKYTRIRSLFGDFTNTYMPNSPVHQACVDLEYAPLRLIVLGVESEIVSKSYVDQTNLTWADGYALLHPRLGVRWKKDKYRAEIALSVRNLFNKEYIAFTEPDPDGNSYQPAPTREVFFNARIWLGGQ
ncbi:MAG TPA: TonB-dependent receptor [Acidobacteriota bacterium]|nr:TonB-dependent receptor [Acidobacteriota bacterium]